MELGLADWEVSALWLISPVSLCFAAPIVGTITDHINTPLGKRTPVLIATSTYAGLQKLPSTNQNCCHIKNSPCKEQFLWSQSFLGSQISDHQM